MDRPTGDVSDALPLEEGSGPTSRARRPRLFNVPPGAPFLPTLVEALCDGRLVPGFPESLDDPLALADATIFVPTRRAARELRTAFVTSLAAGGTARAAILPSIRTLGDPDEDGGLAPFAEAAPETLDLAPVIDPAERTVALAQLTLGWIRALPAHLQGLHGGEAIEVPSSPADAIWLARDLAGLMDEMESRGTDWRKLAEIDVGDQARWWDLTTNFLRIATEAWPAFLSERDRSNPAAHANAAIRAEAMRLEAEGAARRGPVIAAVSPNLGPAQTEFVRAVALHARGAVVIPGIDTDAATLNGVLGLSGAEPSPGHPQFGHARLLDALGASPEEVVHLSKERSARERVVVEAMRAPDETYLWRRNAATLEAGALDGISLVEAPTPREEALAIAGALRGAIEEEGRTAALVTPDRGLARRVAAELRRFGIDADDSAGTPLLATGAGALMRLALAAALEPGDPHALLGLLKHPQARFGLKRGRVRSATLAIELIVLRSGMTGPVEVERLGEMFEERLVAAAAARRKPFWLSRFDAETLDAARLLIGRVRDALTLLADARRSGRPQAPSVWAAQIAYTLDVIGEDAEGRHDRLYGEADGAALGRALRGLMAVREDDGIELGAHEVASAFEALLSGEAVRRPPTGHPRVAILGLIEARLLSFDTLVMGGLNEGSWPRQTTTDAFLSRPMRTALGLDPPERRIGLEAHDFTMAMGAAKVVLTRAKRSDGAPTTPSRWLQRLEAVLPDAFDTMRAEGETLLADVRGLDRSGGRPVRATRPDPAPRVDARPTKLSFTEIETLRRDPYAIYARHVLRLLPLDEPQAEPGAAERGTLFHAIVERFVFEKHDPSAPDAREVLLGIAFEQFEEAGLPEPIRALWWPRLEGVIDPFLAWERERRERVSVSYVEPYASIDVGGTRLTGLADRIDVLKDGTIEIIDYKTGSNPSQREARALLSPQLALEAAVARRGRFGVIDGPRVPAGDPASLLYVRLRPGERRFAAQRIETANTSAADLAERAWHELSGLLASFRDPLTPYPSRVMPQREGALDGTYDHLARAREWMVGDDEDDEEDEA